MLLEQPDSATRPATLAVSESGSARHSLLALTSKRSGDRRLLGAVTGACEAPATARAATQPRSVARLAQHTSRATSTGRPSERFSSVLEGEDWSAGRPSIPRGRFTAISTDSALHTCALNAKLRRARVCWWEQIGSEQFSARTAPGTTPRTLRSSRPAGVTHANADRRTRGLRAARADGACPGCGVVDALP